VQVCRVRLCESSQQMDALITGLLSVVPDFEVMVALLTPQVGISFLLTIR
jgi:hypothetical protein